MPRFAANLSMLFAEVPFLERFEKAAQAGFSQVEYLFPYAYEAQQLKRLLEQNNLQQVLFNLPPGDWEAGERGIACLPGREGEFKEGLTRAIYYAKQLGVNQLNCLAGLRPAELSEELALATLKSNLHFAAQSLAQEGITLLLEAINSRVDMPGFLVDGSDKALALIHDIGLPNIKLQFDLYHMQIMQGDLLRTLARHMADIGHIQFADNPGRHEPGTGEINFSKIFEELDRMGYQGWVSAEYLPSRETAQTLGWLQSFN